MTYLKSKAKYEESKTPEHDNSFCKAKGCPNPWSVDMGSKLCSAHAWSQPHQWPRITEEQYQKPSPEPKPAQRVYRLNEKMKVLQDLRNLFNQPQDMKAWAHKLKAREKSGERLTSQQREAWRIALKGQEQIK
jgi:hypothetical protein